MSRLSNTEPFGASWSRGGAGRRKFWIAALVTPMSMFLASAVVVLVAQPWSSNNGAAMVNGLLVVMVAPLVGSFLVAAIVPARRPVAGGVALGALVYDIGVMILLIHLIGQIAD